MAAVVDGTIDNDIFGVGVKKNKDGEGANPKDAASQSLAATREDMIEEHKNDPKKMLAFNLFEETRIDIGRFSHLSACMMCVFVLTGFASFVFFILSMRNTALPMISEEMSYIQCRNPPWDIPPWGFVKQPNDAPQREIGKQFRYAMPQTTLYYSLCSASFGLFTVCYFCCELLVQDLGVSRVKEMGDVINKGVDQYLVHTVPVILVVMFLMANVVYFLAGLNFMISMLVGASTCLTCSNLGVNMNFEGGPRLTHALNYELSVGINMGIRVGAIGGLSAHAMAQMGIVFVWMVVKDAAALVGFGTGVSIVAFYNRIGGGIFSKGSDIGSDFVSAMLGEDVDDYGQDAFDALLDAQLFDEDGDGELDEEEKRNLKHARAVVDPNQIVEENAMTTKEQHDLTQQIEKKMEESLHSMHPINYLDAIGENIADVGGTASDLFETMCITLACGVIIGSKAHDVPYFGTALPFNIISTGTIGCSTVSYYVWCKEHFTATRIRRNLQLNLLLVIIMVLCTVGAITFCHWKLWGTIKYDTFLNYMLIVAMGLVAPEVCASMCEFFTSVNCPPVAWIANNADLGMIQVILQGLGQGFTSAGVPSTLNIIIQILAFKWEGFYGLVLLACASQACTGWQATLAAYGAVANNANRMVHLTTINEMAHHRANVSALIGTTTSHNGKCVAGQNCFFATTALLGALLADKYTKNGKNFQQTVGQELSEFTRAGLLAGIIFTMAFIANTMTSCIQMAKSLVAFCKDNTEVMPRAGKVFPATHIMPLKVLVGYSSIESFQLSFAPLLHTMAAPLVIGQLFGFKGLLMLVSGGNSVCFSLNMFLINAGQAWDAARKYVLFGMLKDHSGHVVGPDSEVYDTLGIGEQIGGPMEDLAGPGLNNFIKFVTTVSFITSGIYDETPENTWVMGIVQVIINSAAVSFFKFGLAWTINQIKDFFRRRREALEMEEGTAMLREIAKQEEKIQAKRQAHGLKEDDDEKIAALA